MSRCDPSSRLLPPQRWPCAQCRGHHRPARKMLRPRNGRRSLSLRKPRPRSAPPGRGPPLTRSSHAHLRNPALCPRNETRWASSCSTISAAERSSRVTLRPPLPSTWAESVSLIGASPSGARWVRSYWRSLRNNAGRWGCRLPLVCVSGGSNPAPSLRWQGSDAATCCSTSGAPPRRAQRTWQRRSPAPTWAISSRCRCSVATSQRRCSRHCPTPRGERPAPPEGSSASPRRNLCRALAHESCASGNACVSSVSDARACFGGGPESGAALVAFERLARRLLEQHVGRVGNGADHLGHIREVGTRRDGCLWIDEHDRIVDFLLSSHRGAPDGRARATSRWCHCREEMADCGAQAA